MMEDDFFRDESFGPNNTSLGEKVYNDTKEIKGIQWVRASKLHDKPVLFDSIEPNDVAQGKIANCWLMAAISAMAEFGEFVRREMFSQHSSSAADPNCR